MARRTPAPDDMSRAFGLTIAAFGPLLVAALLVPFRDDLASANVVLVFVLVVVCGAAVGTRWSGALAAVVAAMSYDFFFTRPYQSLKIDNANDLETTLLLLAIGLIVAELVAFTRQTPGARRARAATRSRCCGAPPRWWRPAPTSDRVLDTVKDELVELLSPGRVPLRGRAVHLDAAPDRAHRRDRGRAPPLDRRRVHPPRARRRDPGVGTRARPSVASCSSPTLRWACRSRNASSPSPSSTSSVPHWQRTRPPTLYLSGSTAMEFAETARG